MIRPDHQLKESYLEVISHIAYATFFGAVYWYGISHRPIRTIDSNPIKSEQIPIQRSPSNRPLVDRIQQNGDFVINLEGIPSPDDLSQIRTFCGVYNYPSRKNFKQPLPITTPKTRYCKDILQSKQLLVNP